MFRNKVSGHRVQAHRENTTDQQISHWLPSKKVNDKSVESQLHHSVDKFQARRWLRVNHQWSENVEERLKAHPQKLSKRGVKKTGL